MNQEDLLTDPLAFQQLCWPDVTFYDKQVDIIYSWRDNDKTIVPAGNMLGKDFVSAFCAIWFFCSRSPCRLITTSVDGDHLRGVLWGEIRRFISSSRVQLPLDTTAMGSLLLRQKMPDGTIDPTSYLIGRVSKKGEGITGHHASRINQTNQEIHQYKDLATRLKEKLPHGTNRYGIRFPRTGIIFDEASAIPNETHDMAETFAHRMLGIGNCNPCSNFFFKDVEEGDLSAPVHPPFQRWQNGDKTTPDRYYRKIIRLRATDSPNVRLGLAQQALGIEPTNTELVPGVIDYDTYIKRRKLWAKDPKKQAISLDAEFYKGQEVYLFPIEWIVLAEQYAQALELAARINPNVHFKAQGIGVDSAAGSDMTAWCAISSKGLLALRSKRTSNTAVIPNETIAFALKYGVTREQAEKILFDVGGGGQQHADVLRTRKWKVRTVFFGEKAIPELRITSSSRLSRDTKIEDLDTKHAHTNKRTQMYDMLREALRPIDREDGSQVSRFALPTKLLDKSREDGGKTLRQQLVAVPLIYDSEGQLWLPPKHRKPAKKDAPEGQEMTMMDLIGCSPDEMDALVMANYAREVKPERYVVK